MIQPDIDKPSSAPTINSQNQFKFIVMIPSQGCIEFYQLLDMQCFQTMKVNIK